MKTRLLHREIILNKPIEEVFDFFAKAENLEKITPENLRFQILSPPVPVQAGTEIDYKITIWGIRLSWQTLITEFNLNTSFTDLQVKGPYSYWEHQHLFKSLEYSRTLMIDKVFYRIPGWIFEPLLNKFLVRPELDKIFDYRHRKCTRLFNKLN